MADIISFKSAKKQHKARHKEQLKKRSLCQNGHHKWVISTTTPFESLRGKLVTAACCQYCGKKKTVVE